MAFPIDGGKVPLKLLPSIDMNSTAGSLDTSSKAGRASQRNANFPYQLDDFKRKEKEISLILKAWKNSR